MTNINNLPKPKIMNIENNDIELYKNRGNERKLFTPKYEIYIECIKELPKDKKVVIDSDDYALLKSIYTDVISGFTKGIAEAIEHKKSNLMSSLTI